MKRIMHKPLLTNARRAACSGAAYEPPKVSDEIFYCDLCFPQGSEIVAIQLDKSPYFKQKNEAPHVSADPVNHPSHYTGYKGLEIIDLTEQMNFNKGNAVKYVARAGLKGGPEKEIEDLKKAQWYISREIERLEKHGSS